MTKLSVLLPIRGTGLDLRILLQILQAVLAVSHEVLIVVESSQHESIPIVESLQQNNRLRVIVSSKGIVNAIKDGVAQSKGDYILIFAADEVGPVLAINDMLTLAEQGCDFVSCTRYAHGGRRLGGSWISAFLSWLANELFHRWAGSQFTDATTGIKLFRREAFDLLHLEAKPVGWAVAFEMSIKAQMAGLKLGEVPIISIDRLYGGDSDFSLFAWIKEYLRWFIWGFTHLPRQPQHPVQIRIPTADTLLGEYIPVGEKQI